MALSPNYGFPEPDNASLVKNGAQDIRALGDAIDTSVWNVGYGQAGKNKVMNGDFSINQRNFTSITAAGFGQDRWNYTFTGGTATYSAQAFTAGAAPVAGYEAANFARIVTTGQSAVGDLAIFRQGIENVRTFAGQTITFSFYAKAATGTPQIGLELRQSFGTGGSPSSVVENPLGAVTISTSWARYSLTYTMPSLSGKTVGTDPNSSGVYLGMWVSAGSTFATRSSSIGIQNNTFDIWGVQVEYGSKETPFQTASGGSPQAELAMCQRYYYRATDSSTADSLGVWGIATSTTAMLGSVRLPVDMRVKASAVDYANLRVYDGTGVATVTSLSLSNPSPQVGQISVGVASGLVATRPYFIVGNTGNGYLGFSAEL
jgi:hypothetical protein